MTTKRKSMIDKEISIFKAEYPDYTDEHVSAYLELCDDYTNAEKDYFAMKLGF